MLGTISNQKVVVVSSFVGAMAAGEQLVAAEQTGETECESTQGLFATVTELMCPVSTILAVMQKKKHGV